MATAMNFDNLQTTIRRYIERGNTTDTEVFDQLPTLINQAERQIADELKILGQKNIVTGFMVAGTSVYPKPGRWRETVSINFGTGASKNVRTPLLPREYEYIRNYWPDSTARAQPEFYADYGYDNWLFGPTPDDAYPFEITYYQLLPLLDSVNQTNWLTDYAPNLLLYQTLLQTAPFLVNDSRIPTWTGLYTAAKAAISSQDLQRTIDQAASRQGD